jgi:hypothetical protein
MFEFKTPVAPHKRNRMGEQFVFKDKSKTAFPCYP